MDIFWHCTFVKSVILGLRFAFCRAKYVYVRLSQQENKYSNNLKVTVLKQVTENLLPDKV